MLTDKRNLKVRYKKKNCPIVVDFINWFVGAKANICEYFGLHFFYELKFRLTHRALCNRESGSRSQVLIPVSVALRDIPLYGMLIHHRLPLRTLLWFNSNSPVLTYIFGWKEVL